MDAQAVFLFGQRMLEPLELSFDLILEAGVIREIDVMWAHSPPTGEIFSEPAETEDFGEHRLT